MVKALGKQLLEPIHILPKRLMFKLDKREDFIPKSNGLASGKIHLKEDINKRIPRFNRTNLNTIHSPLSIIFENRGNEFHPHNIIWYPRHVNQRTHLLKLMNKYIRIFKLVN